MRRKNENVYLWVLGLMALAALAGKKVMDIKTKSDFKRALQDISTQLGIPFEIVGPQAALESGWGMSGLTRQANNLFGFTAGLDWIKAQKGELPDSRVEDWSAVGHPVIILPTKEFSPLAPEKIKYWEFPEDILEKKWRDDIQKTELMVKRAFRRYQSWEESVQDWYKKIYTLERYAKAREFLRRKDVAGFAKALQEGGYATDPQYATKIVRTAGELEKVA